MNQLKLSSHTDRHSDGVLFCFVLFIVNLSISVICASERDDDMQVQREQVDQSVAKACMTHCRHVTMNDSLRKNTCALLES
jgi:hypothetical protein